MTLIDSLVRRAGEPTIDHLIGDLPQLARTTSFGDDIDRAHRTVLRDDATTEEREAALSTWLRRDQPCLFGRLAARQAQGPTASKGLGYHAVWISEQDLRHSPDAVATRIQGERRAWKDQAERRVSSAFLVVFYGPTLAHALPGEALATLCLRLASLYLLEFGPILADVVYTEAVPLRMSDGGLELYKASTQLFYSSAHLRRNHDRRFPGGVAVVANAPGHYARCLSFGAAAVGWPGAVSFVADTAGRSVGNGGIGHPARLGSSWHGAASGRFSATYHIDTLVQSDVVTDARFRYGPHDPGDVWPDLHLDYISNRMVDPGDPEHGWFSGLPVDDVARHHNPWPPRQAVNSPDFNY